MALSVGKRFAGYEVAALIGVGGMGEVYRATDPALKRSVALKVLSESFVGDANRLARLQREAELLASLSHGNVAHIYGLERSEGTTALVMEFIEGPTLAERIAQGPIPVDEALRIATQIADALDAAHERGIVHRDLKPANIKVRSDGAVKVLDFGLAKALDARASVPGAAALTTPAMTEAGMLLGTPAYMSPEQARGKPVDRRADIWAFGCVLYESLTKRIAFVGETATDTIASVLKQEPDWSRLPATTPPRIRTLLHRCLDKDTRRRLQAIGEARIVIEDVLSRVPDDSASARASTSRWSSLPWGWAALLLVVFAALSSLMAYRVGGRRAVPAAPAVLRMNIDLPPGVTLSGPTLALSPDGSKLAVVGQREGKTRLYLRSVDQEEARPIDGTAGALGPFFSPDGQWIGFWADGRLKKLPLAGGTPTIICDAATENGAAWLRDDVIVFSAGFGLQRVSAQGGSPQVVAARDTSADEIVYESPVALPEANAVMFSIRYNSPGARRVAVLTLNDGKWKTLVNGAEQPRFIAPGFVVVNRSGTLEVAPFDTTRLEVDGPFTRLGEGASTGGAQSMAGGGAVASYDVAAAGRSLVYVNARSTEEERGVYSLDFHGKAELLSSDARAYGDAAVSPDGSKLAVDVGREPGVNEIWVLDLVRKTWLRLTTGQNDWQPTWQDDHTLIHERGRDNAAAIADMYALSVTGNATPMLLASFPHQIGSIAVAPNHSAVVFAMIAASSRDLWTQPLGRDGKAPDREAVPLVATPADEDVIPCGFSPDGRWLAYRSDATGRREIYVTDFPAGSTHYPVSSSGGTDACWSKDGHQIFYWKGNTVMAVAVRSGETFAAETPHALFDSPVTNVWGYDVARDGSVFYVAGYEASRTSPIVFVSDITGHLRSGANAH